MDTLTTETITAAAPVTAQTPPPVRAAALSSTFAQMRIKVGDQLHLEPPRRSAGGRATVIMLGWLEGQSVIVTAPQNGAGRLVLQEGELVLMRAFTGKSAFAFRASALKSANLPFHYVHLSFPDKVEGVAIRNSPRCRVQFPAQVSAGGKAAFRGTVLNIGTSGALVETADPLDQNEGLIQIAFSLELHGVAVSLDLRAQVCGAKGAAAADGAPRHQYGVEFKELQPNDRLILGSLVWYQMYEHPRSVT
jgi:hypothetical protein